VTILLEAVPSGTRLQLLHEFAEAAPRDEHIQGWRFQLSLFGNVVANEAFANVASVVDDWFAAWIIADEQARQTALAKIVTPGIQFRDRFSLLDGIDDLTAHLGASTAVYAGVPHGAEGRHPALPGNSTRGLDCDRADGQPRMNGTNVFVFGPDVRIESVTGVTS